jgi:hypothetical protein
VLVDAEHQGAIQREAFTGFSGCKLRIDAGDGCGSHLFESAHHGTGDAFVVKCIKVFPEGFAGVAAREDAWQRFNKGTHAGFAPEATAPDL